MVDTARHFQSLASLRRIVDSLPYAKINVHALPPRTPFSAVVIPLLPFE